MGYCTAYATVHCPDRCTVIIVTYYCFHDGSLRGGGTEINKHQLSYPYFFFLYPHFAYPYFRQWYPGVLFGPLQSYFGPVCRPMYFLYVKAQHAKSKLWQTRMGDYKVQNLDFISWATYVKKKLTCTYVLSKPRPRKEHNLGTTDLRSGS